ncbi:Cof-type HAD-IIB family hydrolase [Massilistercora timonensis]|uniref:Cof-type HAD-IIB family hydrolase n=1 Tax=Massilistercora timonensis TaxID=2086584 RepID=UPI00320ACFEA
MKYKVRMIAFDLDGTLLTTDKRLTDETRRTLEQAAKRGILLVPATGRPLTGMPAEVLGIAGVRYAITANGARVVSAEDGKILREKLISVEKARKVLDIYGEYDTLREIYYDGQGYMEARQMEQLDHYVPDPNMAKYMRNTRKCVPDLMEKFRQENRAMDKVQAVFACAGEKEQAFRRIREMEGVEATGALSYNIEVTAGGINKGEALLWLAGELGIDREEILAFGDGANDADMIRAAGIGAAMEVSVLEVRAAADILAGSNDEDGVARAIQRYIDLG